ncbi:serine/threonine dehydratase [Aestuariivivens sp. NBU2969]|uniref:serine/threonine dehydratase n=1 Tax=Aestuariivivens sp. NBU2969 TaxID=2873267 RepID=UPI001CC0A64E|nr:serine/threonine dehydratase [Aestuariivivens sp. NBU2969]
MNSTLELKDIINAKSRISGLVNETPILTSSLLNTWLGHTIYFKAEGFQKIGAFKARGACNTIAWLIENHHTPKHFVANSSGNHAQAVAWAANRFDIPATIYMPDYSSKVKIQATKAYGAQVILCETRQEADDLVKRASENPDTYWIPPYNHEQVICGQGTVALEAMNSIGEVDAVFGPCGGGGLLSGSLIASRGLSKNIKVIGAEPLAGNDAAESLRKNSIQRLSSAPNTLADGAMTLAVGDITFEYLKQLDDFYEITEDTIIYWTQWLTHLLKSRIEPTSALGMEAAFQWLQKQKGKKTVLIILSGANIDQATTNKIWQNDCLTTEPFKL